MQTTPVTQDHELKETLMVDYNTPGHDPRGSATALFHRTRLALIEREQGKCWVSGKGAAELGAPLEAHHCPVERSFAERWDWPLFADDCKAGKWGPHAQAFDWTSFFSGAVTITPDDTGGAPYLKVVDPYAFVDDMTVNGVLLGKQYHTTPGTGIHTIPWPVLLAVKYLAEGYKFSDTVIVHHEQEARLPASQVGNGEPPPLK